MVTESKDKNHDQVTMIKELQETIISIIILQPMVINLETILEAVTYAHI
jgi:hypothetical protein